MSKQNSIGFGRLLALVRPTEDNLQRLSSSSKTLSEVALSSKITHAIVRPAHPPHPPIYSVFESFEDNAAWE